MSASRTRDSRELEREREKQTRFVAAYASEETTLGAVPIFRSHS